MSSNRYNPRLFYSALLLALATFPLIFIGGLVTSHGAGMAVPDWPNSYGYNMFLFPPSKWVGNIWYEHVHRLYASFIGILCIAFFCFAGGLRPLGRLVSNRMSGPRGRAVGAFLERSGDGRPVIQRLGIAILLGVILQGVLGGLRVVLVNLELAIVHGCFAQAFFSLTAITALVTSPLCNRLPDLSESSGAPAGRFVVRLALAAVVVVFCQLIVGAVMRHEQAGLAIPDFPLAYGGVLPPANSRQLDQVNALRLFKNPCGPPIYQGPDSFYWHWMELWPRDVDTLFLPEVSMLQVWLAFAHRIGAVIVSLTLIYLVFKVVRLPGRPLSLLLCSLFLALLLLTQLTLGALTVLLRKPADIASLHVAVGSLVLVGCCLLAAQTIRLYRRSPAQGRRGFEIIAPTPNAPLGTRSLA